MMSKSFCPKPVFQPVLLLLVLGLVLLIISTPSFAWEHETDDDLLLGGANGRITDLEVGNVSVDFCGSETGGFYIRDYTLDPATGLPDGLDAIGNMMECADFETNCETCLESEGTWAFSENIPGLPSIQCTELTLSTGTTNTARIIIPTGATGSTYYIGIFQDININSEDLYQNPTTHDLFCFSFDLATACGFRPKDHPEYWDDDSSEYGNHQIISRIDWFGSDPSSVPFTPTPPTITQALAYTEAKAWESTGIATSVGEDVDELTSYGSRSYRPLDATWVRVGVIVEGYIPRTDVSNAVYFDNFALYKAPPIIPVKTDDLLTSDDTDFDILKDLNGYSLSPALQMKASVNKIDTTDGDYLLISGIIINNDPYPITPPLPARALDLGFALPIDDQDERQELVWWDDMGNSDDIGSSEQVLPFRMAGPIDIRPDQTSKYYEYPSATRAEISKLRSECTQVSAYPFSSLAIGEGTGLRGLSFGDDLASESIAISHFGYRVTQPDTFRGMYYVEFRLGILPENTSGHVNYAPFSFILFRGDNPSWVEKSTFREAAERYQMDIFPDSFSRPTLPGTHPDYLWQFGGGVSNAKTDQDYYGDLIPEDNTFNNNAAGYGLRYTQLRYGMTDAALMTEFVDIFNDIGVGTLVYEQPWRGAFRNPISETDMNHYDNLISLRDSYDPDDPPIDWEAIWTDIYDAQNTNFISLPGDISLFSRLVKPRFATGNPLEWYSFPVLLIDDDTLGDLNVVEQEIEYISAAYANVSDESVSGLKGMEYDNLFYGNYSANHLDLTSDRLSDYVDAGGILTYSINHLAPAIPQLGPNVWFLKDVQVKLAEIDDEDETFGDGGENSPTTPEENIEDEVLSGNFNEPLFGGSKYGIMNADIGGFESSVGRGNFNKSERAQNFRRGMARDKNMSRLLTEFPIATCILDVWATSGCGSWNALWGTDNFDDFRIQLMNEAAWMSLAWGFMPSITAYLPEDDDFFDASILPLFEDDPLYGLSYTNIFMELHLAGWRPITNTVLQYDGTPPAVDLRVERFGDSGDSSDPGDAIYFTVLNNDDLTLTPINLAKLGATGSPAKKSIEEVEELQEYYDLEICELDFSCADFPSSCPSSFKDKEKDFYLNVYNAVNLGIVGTGNIQGIQLVHSPENASVCNWAAVTDAAFSEGSGSDDYSIKRLPVFGGQIRIGGYWPWGGLIQYPISIPDKALMVFKIWLSTRVDNGDGGGEQRSSSAEEDSPDYRGDHYERYGESWQTYDNAGYNGTVDAAVITDPDACAYYTINTSTSESLDVLVHFPPNRQATAAAKYDVYITDYLEGSAKEAALGDPILTTVIDQTDSDAYSTAADADGFITIGTIDVELQEPETMTIVIKLSAAEDRTESTNPSALLISDAVMVVPVD